MSGRDYRHFENLPGDRPHSCRSQGFLERSMCDRPCWHPAASGYFAAAVGRLVLVGGLWVLWRRMPCCGAREGRCKALPCSNTVSLSEGR